MPGENCSILGCGTCRNQSTWSIFKIPTKKQEKWRSEVLKVILRYREKDASLRGRVESGKLYVCKRHYKSDMVVQCKHEINTVLNVLYICNNFKIEWKKVEYSWLHDTIKELNFTAIKFCDFKMVGHYQVITLSISTMSLYLEDLSISNWNLVLLDVYVALKLFFFLYLEHSLSRISPYLEQIFWSHLDSISLSISNFFSTRSLPYYKWS